jgi:hypothetical protein
LVIARSSPAVVEHAVDLRGKLVSCVPGWYCNVALYLGARTLYDGRTEPFSAQRIADLSASLEDPSVLRRWPVDVAMVSPNDAPALRAAGWREIAGSQFIAIFRR